jgi:hypothetical protein
MDKDVDLMEVALLTEGLTGAKGDERVSQIDMAVDVRGARMFVTAFRFLSSRCGPGRCAVRVPTAGSTRRPG